MLKKRIIPCLDIKDGRTVKGINFVNIKDAGDPIELAKKYADQGADELVFLDITATIDNRDTLIELVSKIAKEINIPLRLKKNIKWYWDETLNLLLQDAKNLILKQINDGVRSFELSRPTCLWTDWSKHGLGFTLLQKFCNCDLENAPTCCANGYKLVFTGSRFTTETESRYAPIEGEALAVVYALEKCRMFVIGCPNLILVVDHKPLVKIFMDKSLETISNPHACLISKRKQYYMTLKLHLC